MIRRIAATSLAALLLAAGAGSAAAKIPEISIAPQTMSGSSLYGTGSDEFSAWFSRYDVLTRQYSVIDPFVPGVATEWDPAVSSSYGVATLAASYTDANTHGNFTLVRFTAAGARRNLISFDGQPGYCDRALQPTEISPKGVVRTVDLYLRPSGRACAIDAARTALREFPVSGKSKRLWFPPKYAALLYGGRLQTSGRWATVESEVSGFEDYKGALELDLVKRKKVRNLNPGRLSDTVTVRLGRDGAALVTGVRGGTWTTLLYPGPSSRAKKLLSSSRRTQAFMCGRSAAIYSGYQNGIYERLDVRDMEGKRTFALAPGGGQLLKPVACSERYLLVRDAALAPREDESAEYVLGEIRLIDLRGGVELP